MKATKRKATGILADMLSAIDELSLAQTRNKMLIAAKIADAIKEKGLSQKTVAAQMGKTESEISEWLSGDRNFTIDTLTELERYLRIRLIDSTQFGIRVYNQTIDLCTRKKKPMIFTRMQNVLKVNHQNMTTSYAG